MQIPQISRARAAVYAVGILVVLVLLGRFAFARPDHGGLEAPAQSALPAHAAVASKAPARRLYVHVVGAVRRPGLYRIRDGSRVNDAIRLAGGAKPKADLALVNLASPVADGQQIVVPRRGEAPSAGAAPGLPGQAVPGALPAQKVHLNSATLEELDTLPGVGPVTAQKILAYRTEHGAFKSVDELDAVSGIGPARMDELRPLVDL